MQMWLVEAQQGWTRLHETGALLDAVQGGPINTFLVERDPAHLPWAGETAATVEAGRARASSVSSLVTPARFWAHHPDVPRDALRLRILLSYWYFKEHDLDTLIPQKFTPPYPCIFADSGAFSAATQRVAIRWQDYAAWLKRYRHWFQVMANLDVIGNPMATQAHQEALEDAGLPVLPVFHAGEPWAVLDRLLTRYRYIGLGGLVGSASAWRTTLMPWLVQCFKRGQGTAVFHGFGCTTWEIIKALPWYSVDSSSWGAGFRYGRVPLFEWQRGRFAACDLGDPVSVGKVAPLIRALGFEPADFALRARNTRAHNCGIAALSYCLAAAWLQRRWQGHAALAPSPALPGGHYLVETNTTWNTVAPAAQALDTLAAPSILLSDTSTGVNYADAATAVSAVAACPEAPAVYLADNVLGATFVPAARTVAMVHREGRPDV
jgi:hypothetical protein